MDVRPLKSFAMMLVASGLISCAVPVMLPAQTASKPAQLESPYGGTTVEDIIARVNERIISRSDYERAANELEQEERQRGLSMQEIADSKKDLLRNLIDQQLWLSKGKELGLTGETELVKQLDEIRKKYNLATLEDLEKAAKEQGVSYEDFKANIRNGIVTQLVMRKEVGEHIQVTQGEEERYFNAHKQDYVRPESVRLSEILVSTGAAAPSATGETEQPIDPNKLATAKAKVDDLEAKLKAGTDFAGLARTASDGPTASQGGDLGTFKRGTLAKALEDATFNLDAGQVTEPIRTRQGYVILKVAEHEKGGAPEFKDVQQDVEQAYYMSRMEPAIRSYLTQMREEAFIDIKPGYADSGASLKETKPVYSAYVPPSAKKKRKVERTRFRETGHGFRQKSATPAEQAQADTEAAKTAQSVKVAKKQAAKEAATTQQAGKREKIRYGQAPRETLPGSAAETKKEDAGALPEQTAQANQDAIEEATPEAPKQKTRFTSRAPKVKVTQDQKAATADKQAPVAPDSGEVADRQTQSTPLGLNGDTATKKKKKVAEGIAGDKTRFSDRAKKPADDSQQPAATPQAPQPQQ